jgi:hypothetical protein
MTIDLETPVSVPKAAGQFLDHLWERIKALGKTRSDLKEVTENKRELADDQKLKLLASLEARFAKTPGHYKRSEGIDFSKVKAALEAAPEKMWSLAQMENTGGAPDVIAIEGDEFVFADCSAESPKGRRNCVANKEAEQYAKDFNGNAVDMAQAFGVDIMTDDTYKNILHELGRFFDIDTSNWVVSADPAKQAEIRKSGKALLATLDYDYGLVLVYPCDASSNGVDFGWRGVLRVKMV